jgi:hypothetical protein
MPMLFVFDKVLFKSVILKYFLRTRFYENNFFPDDGSLVDGGIGLGPRQTL